MSCFDCSSVVAMVNLLSPQIYKEIEYVKNLEENSQKLQEKNEELDSKRKDIEYEINVQRRRNKRVTYDCQNWLKKVKDLNEVIDKDLKEIKDMDKRCFKMWCFNIWSSRNLGQKIVLKINNISELINKIPSKLLIDKLPTTAEEMSYNPICKGTSVENALHNILEYIYDVNIYKVGIWGMCGIGKTTIMKNLQHSPKIEGMFEIVIWITLGKDFNIQDMQNEIAECLQVPFSGKDNSNKSRSRILLKELKCKKFMILLDDVWDKINFAEIGIPFNQGSKVVLTTRYDYVCHKMKIDHKIKVPLLSKDESWKLFCDLVDGVDSPQIEPLARTIVKECGGLPLALTVVAGSLRGEEITQIWENLMNRLSYPEKQRSIKDDIDEKVYDLLEFNVNMLESESLKNCFLYAALYPNGYEIDIFELIEYWRVEGFFDSTSGLKEARNEGYEHLKRLVDSSLIECEFDNVKMHDLLRDVALRIVSRSDSSNKFHVIAEGKTSLESDQWIEAKRISMICNEMNYHEMSLPMNFPNQPINCPSLKTLIFRCPRLKVITRKFFHHMKSLRVLDLSGTGIKSLPPSIANLVSLVGLYLRECDNLKALPPQIGSLKRLEVLDMLETGIYELPMKVSQLIHLRFLGVKLDVQDGHNMDRAMRSGILRSLKRLEELQIDVTPKAYKSKWGSHEKLVDEVCSLNELTSLAFTFRDVEYLKQFTQKSSRLKAGAIKCFSWSIGDSEYGIVDCINRGLSVVSIVVDDIRSIPWPLLPPPNELTIISSTNTSVSEIGMQYLNNLTWCCLSSCDAMEIPMKGLENIISNADGKRVLPILEGLTIDKMRNMKGIWDGYFPKGSFAGLNYLYVADCNNLKNLLSYEISQHLSNLIGITIENCSALEEVISIDQIGESGNGLLPQLQHLSLSSLPKLVAIVKDDFLSYWPSLETIDVDRNSCPQLKKLPLGLNNAPELREIMCDKAWWDELIWSDDAIKLKLAMKLKLPIDGPDSDRIDENS